jgi:tRNA modification GTPase
MRLAKKAVAAADLTLWVLDGAEPGGGLGPIEGPALLLINKVDLAAAWDWDTLPHALRVSAQTGSGLEQLCGAISRALVPEPPPAGAAVPFTAALSDHLDTACRLAREGKPAEARSELETLLRSPLTG